MKRMQGTMKIHKVATYCAIIPLIVSTWIRDTCKIVCVWSDSPHMSLKAYITKLVYSPSLHTITPAAV
jgi:hypothetical protein